MEKKKKISVEESNISADKSKVAVIHGNGVVIQAEKIIYQQPAPPTPEEMQDKPLPEEVDEPLADVPGFTDLLKMADDFRDTGIYKQSIVYYDKALEIIPSYKGLSDDAWLGKGFCFEKLGKYEEALNCFDKVLEIDSKSYLAWYNKAIIFGRSGKEKEELECWDKVTEIDHQDYGAWWSKGICYSNLGDDEEALGCYNMATKINTRYGDAWYNKGVVLERLGRSMEAEKCFNRAEELEDMDLE